MESKYITSKPKEKLPLGFKWAPTIGDETQRILNYFRNIKNISKESCNRLRDEAIRILSKCGNPSYRKNSNTGLVFGYIQSGKTMSYTTLAALAKDNKYQIIIIIAGITKNLLHQTENRLKKDLQINMDGNFGWKVFQNPEKSNRSAIGNVLELNRKFPQIPHKTILITVLKNAGYLKKLVSLLKSFDLKSVPTLIIDDEGDQASMNTVARRNAKLNEKGMSTIYSTILELKEVLPHHTLLQYTATPQAPIFINIYDRLSPNFIELLDPGEDYVGGKELFEENSNLIKEIPASEIFKKDDEMKEPPDSLMDTMRIFFLCVALGLSNKNLIKSRHLSMMVHPSHLTAKHNVYHNWVIKIIKSWAGILNKSDDTPKKQELLSEFEESYDILKQTNSNLPDFQSIVTKYLNPSLVIVDVHQLNSKTGITDVEWNSYSYILIGGQVLDRGFTVEGLIMTYMPRGTGAGNADSVEQRARFLGYKRDYLSFCRVYLSSETKDFYEKYLLHEEHLRDIIQKHNQSGKPLNDLRRRVILSPELRPTRPNVLSKDFRKYTIGDWFMIKAPHDSKEIIEYNKKITEKFINKLKWEVQEGHKNRTLMQIHNFSEISLKEVLTGFLGELSFTRESDAFMFTQLVKAINDPRNNPISKKCMVYLMSGGKPRVRSLSKKDEILTFFQGQNPMKGKGEIIYPGDAKIKKSDQVCIQIHKLILKENKKLKFKDVYTIAVWLPEELGQDYQELIENE